MSLPEGTARGRRRSSWDGRIGEAAGWTLRLRLIHWVSALAVAAEMAVGFFLLAGTGMAGRPWLSVHLSLGVAILGLSLARLVCRLLEPGRGRRRPRLFDRMAGLGHAGLYLLLVIVPATGWLGYRPPPFQAPPHLFGVLPTPVAAGTGPVAPRTMLAVHSLASWILLGLVALHVTAALVHGLVLRDGVVRGMIRGGRSAPDRA